MLEALRRGLQRRRHPQRHALLAELLDNQSLSREALLDKQQRAFAAMVAYAAAHSPYYAGRYAPLLAGGHMPPIQELPILTKADVVRHRDALRVRDIAPGRAKLGHTGGSTGQPLAFWYDDAKHERMRAGMMRGFMMSGWRPGQKILHFWGARQDTVQGGVFAHPAADWIAAERTISAVEFTPQRLGEWARAIQRWRPTLLYGYASVLAQLAWHIVDQRLAMPASLLAVYATAEPLQDGQRALLERAFACKAFNQYGCREVPNIAWECRHGGLHVMADLVRLESVPGEDGDRLLVTSLTDRLMPFIRYDLGDSGRLLAGECPCGAPFPLMEMGLCRHNDLIRTAAGKRVHPAFFNRLLYGMTQVHQYQWVQQDLRRMVLSVVAAEPLGGEVVARLADSIRREVDEGMTLEVRRVDEIPRTVSGKHRFVIGLAQ